MDLKQEIEKFEKGIKISVQLSTPQGICDFYVERAESAIKELDTKIKESLEKCKNEVDNFNDERTLQIELIEYIKNKKN
jgi:hypothetical protein